MTSIVLKAPLNSNQPFEWTVWAQTDVLCMVICMSLL